VAEINPPFASRIINEDDVVNFVPMRAVEGEGGGLVRPELRPYGEVKKGYKSFLAGDVIMAKITPCMENGKTAVVPKLRGEVCFGSTEFHVMRPEDGVESRWIANFFLQHEVRRTAQRQMAGGVGQMRVPASFLEAIRIPVPPAEEQTRISDAIDELFSDLDAGLAALERVREKLKLYRASILKAAVEGALTAGWRTQHPHTEPATEILKRILTERRRRWEEDQLAKFKAKGQGPPRNWKGKHKEPIVPDITNLPPLPEGWCWTTVGQLGGHGEQPVLTGPFGTNLGRSDFVETGIPLLTIGCLTWSGISLDKAEFVTHDKAEELKRYRLRVGDLMFSRMASVGRAGYVTPEIEGALFNYHLMRLRFASGGVIPKFILTYVQGSGQVMRYIKDVNHGATRDGINTDQLLALPVALPPIAEQEAIVEAVEDQLSIIDHLETDLEAKLMSANALRQAILRHAFTGELVPQAPNDEPASELLKRIALERKERARESAEAKRETKSSNGPKTGRRGRPKKTAKGND
jgi:type I restriction enzyme S subunit